MRIAIVHYHLRAGGVSRVIELACRALQECGFQIAVLAGDTNSTISNLVPTAAVPALDYNRSPSFSQTPGTLQRDLEKTARSLLGGPPDVWHIHNHSLGKNPLLPQVITSWAREGQALLLQIHDFAENQRPSNYRQLLGTYGKALNTLLYPCSPRIAYALLNSRDEQLLKRARFPGNFFRLPNPALPLPVHQKLLPKDFGTEKLVVYPCRAIRRKNIGEALLLACTFACGVKRNPYRLVLASAPSSPGDVASHERWKALARSRQIPVEFDACSQRNIFLGDLVSAAESVFTTSMEEGFGMTFLEAWLANKSLIGRDLPSITCDFRSAGLVLDSLYDFLGVPISLIGKERIENSLVERLEKKFLAAEILPSLQVREKILNQALREDQVDFGRLDSTLQEEVVHLASESSMLAQEIVPSHPLATSETIESNRRTVEKQYSLASYALKLTENYQLLASARSTPLVFGDSQAILSEFLMI